MIPLVAEAGGPMASEETSTVFRLGRHSRVTISNRPIGGVPLTRAEDQVGVDLAADDTGPGGAPHAYRAVVAADSPPEMPVERRPVGSTA